MLVTLFDNSSFRFHRMKQAEGRGSGGAAAPNPLEGDPPLSLFLPFILAPRCCTSQQINTLSPWSHSWHHDFVFMAMAVIAVYEAQEMGLKMLGKI